MSTRWKTSPRPRKPAPYPRLRWTRSARSGRGISDRRWRAPPVEERKLDGPIRLLLKCHHGVNYRPGVPLYVLALMAIILACGGDKSTDEARSEADATPATPVTRPTFVPATVTPVLTGSGLLEALRGGGYILVFRHALT